MKLVFGPGKNGTPIPRYFNPLVFLGVSIVMAFSTVFIALGALLCLVWLPFSIFHTVRMTDK